MSLGKIILTRQSSRCSTLPGNIAILFSVVPSHIQTTTSLQGLTLLRRGMEDHLAKTEQVENVKTLLLLLLLLFTLAPTYVLQVPASLNFFTVFGHHLSFEFMHSRHHDDCTTEQLWSLIVEIACLTALISNTSFPLYIWLMYSVCRRKPLIMLTHLKLGILLCFLGVFSMLITDLVDHSVYTDHTSNTMETLCMF